MNVMECILQVQGIILALSSNNLVTIGEELYWSIVYYSNVVTQDVATEYAELVFKTLKAVT